MGYKILFRINDPSDKHEIEHASKHFDCITSRMLIDTGDVVIGRYSVLPFYSEQEHDIKLAGAKLINTYQQHLYAADIGTWTLDLGELTPRTWHRLEDIPEKGPFVIKGETNSRKDKWSTHMYAETKRDAIEVACRLMDDMMIGTQKLYIRQYIPLKKLMTGLNDLPVSEEHRFFALNGQIICGAFYWSSYVDDLVEIPRTSDVPGEFLKTILNKIGDNIPFVVIDVARTESGEWIVVELNDGQMSGLSENDPERLYSGMRQVLMGC